MAQSIPLFDHIVYAVPDLEEGIAAFFDWAGVAPVHGGSHPGWGTRNALVGLGGRSYLEIIGPDPSQNVGELPLGVRREGEQKVTTWAVAVTDLGARAVPDYLGKAQSMERARPDGSVLRWSLTDPFADRMGGVIPFLIDWGDSRHPTEGLEPLCRVERFALMHPNAEVAGAAIRSLGFDLPVEASDAPGIAVELWTPKGLITL